VTASERRRAILERLCVRRHDTRENLAFAFGVCKRTIERDIVTLSLDYPIYTVQGCRGGIFVEKWYRTDRKYLTEEQSELLERLSEQLQGHDADVMQTILKAFSIPH